MTTGSKSRFTMNLKIFKNGPNLLVSGNGRDSSGQFDIEDGLILGEACFEIFQIYTKWIFDKNAKNNYFRINPRLISN